MIKRKPKPNGPLFDFEGWSRMRDAVKMNGEHFARNMGRHLYDEVMRFARNMWECGREDERRNGGKK